MIYAGCSGYSFKEWVGRFYPPKTPAKRYLAHYASQLGSVEVNYTFRRFPRVEVSESWAEQTPSSFRFALKMHQSVTHRHRLNNVGQSVSDFLESLLPLGPRLGVVLFQLPPFFKCDLDRLDAFLADLPGGHRFAMEFRHESWSDPAVLSRLREAGVALCAAELEIDHARVVTTAPFAYVRLRKTPPYADAEIQTVRSLLNNAAAEVEDIYLYVKHDEEGAAPEQVRRMTMMD